MYRLKHPDTGPGLAPTPRKTVPLLAGSVSENHSKSRLTARPCGGGFRIFIFDFVCLWVCTGPPDQMKNDTDLKFGTHTPLDHI